jgi:predicted polyphosphate/ATP-dependent NAD kinase
VNALGLVVNPIAGMGGRVCLHGTDGEALAAARERGAEAVAPLRARRAVHRMHGIPVVTAAGAMGADHVPEATVCYTPGDPTSAADTRRAAGEIVRAGVSLLLFVGGDGTARDILDVVGTDVPVLGVPAGVKMRSGVFAVGPEAAGETAVAFLANPVTMDAEVVDLVGDTTELFGVAKVPNVRNAMARAKSGPAAGPELAALGREVAGEMLPGRLYLLGPGTTVAHVSAALGVPSSPLGVDVVRNGQLVAQDATEAELLAMVRDHPATLVLGVVGGQGFLLGRGNQQLSADVLAEIGDSVEILAAAGKVAALDPPVLRIDVGDERATAPISGYRKVRTAPGRSTVLRVKA